MATRGVKTIEGPITPIIGSPAIYTVTEWYEDTTEEMKATVQWGLFKRESSGDYEAIDPIKTGDLGIFTFTETAVDGAFKVVGYLFDPDLTDASSINVNPAQGPASIIDITILDYQGNEFTETPKYGQIVTISVNTVNMIGEELTASLWERDTYAGGGHYPYDNVKLWEGKTIVENINGTARIQKILTIDMAEMADNSAFEGGIHEYYAVVEAERLNDSEHSQQELGVSSDISEYDVNYIVQDVLRAQGVGIDPIPEDIGSSSQAVGEERSANCGEQFCIKIGDKSELIREVNIRLAGFGGNVPTDEFTDRTEEMIKQFQRDYMEVPETGKICGNVLRAIDDFESKYSIIFDELKCPCGTCNGFGQGQYSEQKQDSSIAEMSRRYEYPGIHRSLLWSYKALMFYLTKKEEGIYSINTIYSGYRCHVHNAIKGRTSTNHMGKAIDIHFNKNGIRTKELEDIEEIRDNIIIPANNAQVNWASSNLFSLEPSRDARHIADTWIHMDVRQFELQYLEDQFFANTVDQIKGRRIVELAREGGFAETCDCRGPSNISEVVNCGVCTALDEPRMEFYKEFGTSAINMVESKGLSNKFKGLYMVAQRRQENGFNLHVPNNNPMNIKGRGDAGSATLQTHEFINGERVNMPDDFANFTTVEKGFEGYLELLNRNFNGAYVSILDDSKTIDDFLTGLQDNGRIGAYATDPNYKANVKNIFNGVVRDYKKWLDCKLSCDGYSSQVEEIEADIELLNSLE